MKIFFPAIVIFVSLTVKTSAECSFNIDSELNVAEPRSIFDKIDELDVEKGTFETEEEYLNRKLKILERTFESFPNILVYSNKDDTFNGDPTPQINYDAENERVLYNQYFFSNAATFSDKALKSKGIHPIEELYSSQELINIGLISLDVPGPQGVYDKVRLVLSAADLEKTKMEYSSVFETETIGEMPSLLGDGVEQQEVMEFDLPSVKAQSLFANLRPAISITLKEPYLISYDDYVSRDWQGASVDINSYHLVGQINCGFIVSPNGNILDIAKIPEE